MPKNVMILEDEPLVAMLVESMVSELGMTPTVPKSIDDAYRIANETRPDAALIDFNLWGGSSVELTNEFRRRGIPVAIMSGYDSDEIRRVFGDIPTIEKPFQSVDLEAFLHGTAA